ncbi:sulfotransferase 1E1-like [Anthonomus grandis grandis]|uniref:sulfotransferase 1E1-like n=1 Tax=Anthonomus grandis grandis TaxID=2921223 RepID=UPI0021667270|nr:sulfotransferase 1E1-like [Anthonomus grandis grandis]
MATITPVDPSLNLKLKKQYAGGIFGEDPNFVQVGSKKWFFPERFQEYSSTYKHFKVRSDDVWINGYPRSGTSVTADICWMLTHKMNFEVAKSTAFNDRSKLFELNTLFGKQSDLIKDAQHQEAFRNLFMSLENDPERRVIKTHLPYELLPDNLLTCGAKVIYIVRNIKDVALSFYNLQSTPTRENFGGNFEDFWSNLETDCLTFAPYWKHVEQGLQPAKNKLIVFYEEQIQDLRKGIKKLADFLEVSLTETQLDEMTDFFSFENYKKVTQGKNFFNDNFEHVRKGQSGQWKKEFPDYLKKRADKWIQDNIKRSKNGDKLEKYLFSE